MATSNVVFSESSSQVNTQTQKPGPRTPIGETHVGPDGKRYNSNGDPCICSGVSCCCEFLCV